MKKDGRIVFQSKSCRIIQIKSYSSGGVDDDDGVSRRNDVWAPVFLYFLCILARDRRDQFLQWIVGHSRHK